jgi:glutathione S-transferase
MKVENYLRMTSIPYEVVDDFALAKAPKGKLPYIEDAGRAIADSGLILDYLKATYGDPRTPTLSPRRRQSLSLSSVSWTSTCIGQQGSSLAMSNQPAGRSRGPSFSGGSPGRCGISFPGWLDIS